MEDRSLRRLYYPATPAMITTSSTVCLSFRPPGPLAWNRRCHFAMTLHRLCIVHDDDGCAWPKVCGRRADNEPEAAGPLVLTTGNSVWLSMGAHGCDDTGGLRGERARVRSGPCQHGPGMLHGVALLSSAHAALALSKHVLPSTKNSSNSSSSSAWQIRLTFNNKIAHVHALLGHLGKQDLPRTVPQR